MNGCRYNTCSICAFSKECGIYKGYKAQKEINLNQVEELEEHKVKIIELEEEVAVLKAHLRG